MSKIRVLNASVLKWIAVITMIIDHVGGVFFPEYEILRWIGRISFPLFAFLIAEGYKHTSDIRKYAVRLLIFALISEVPFDYCFHSTLFYPYKQNVFFELLLGLLTLYFIDKEYVVKGKNITIFCQLAIVAVSCGIAYIGKFDYKYVGILVIVIMNYIRDYYKYLAPTIFVIYLIVYGVMNAVFVLIPIAIIYLYNGQRGASAKKLKWVFYAIYPVQLVVIGLIRDYVVK